MAGIIVSHYNTSQSQASEPTATHFWICYDRRAISASRLGTRWIRVGLSQNLSTQTFLNSKLGNNRLMDNLSAIALASYRA